MKAINRKELFKKIEENKQDRICLTIERCINSIKQVKVINDEQALVLLGTNVYTFNSKTFVTAVKSLIKDYDESELTPDLITELVPKKETKKQKVG